MAFPAATGKKLKTSKFIFYPFLLVQKAMQKRKPSPQSVHGTMFNVPSYASILRQGYEGRCASEDRQSFALLKKLAVYGGSSQYYRFTVSNHYIC